jgi:cytoskeletal protein CcmA (bactofilin family)
MESTEITSDIVFRGEISYEGKLEVSGRVEGKVSSEGALILNSTGFIKGDVKVRQVSLKGDMTGNIACDLISILNSGKLFGDIECKQLQVDRGGVHNGTTIMT